MPVIDVIRPLARRDEMSERPENLSLGHFAAVRQKSASEEEEEHERLFLHADVSGARRACAAAAEGQTESDNKKEDAEEGEEAPLARVRSTT